MNGGLLFAVGVGAAIALFPLESGFVVRPHPIQVILSPRLEGFGLGVIEGTLGVSPSGVGEELCLFGFGGVS